MSNLSLSQNSDITEDMIENLQDDLLNNIQFFVEYYTSKTHQERFLTLNSLTTIQSKFDIDYNEFRYCVFSFLFGYEKDIGFYINSNHNQDEFNNISDNLYSFLIDHLPQDLNLKFEWLNFINEKFFDIQKEFDYHYKLTSSGFESLQHYIDNNLNNLHNNDIMDD
jgi:hypothetical protein